jgi:pimeloyl-ACP methyl ester carboxylesterase
MTLASHSVGSGPPLLLVNGYAATGADWDPTFVELLAASHRVICPDNRGLGGSELGDGELTVEAMAADLEALLDELEVERTALAGWSMGGFVAQRLARRVPERVTALALIATDPGGPDVVAAEPAVWQQLTDRSGSAREQASRLLPLLFPPALAPAIDAQFGDLIAAGRAAMSADALAAQERAMEGWHQDGVGDPHGMIPPTLVIHGEEDVVIPAANAEPLAAHWPGARIELIAGAAHAVMAQEPQRVAAAIDELTGPKALTK